MIRAAIFALTGFLLTAGPMVSAEETGPRMRTVDAAFSDVLLELQDAVIGRGLVIDYTGHVDKMLERTAEAAGSITETGEKSPYLSAKYMQFCSAKLTHEAVAADPANLSICPYIVYLYETRDAPGQVHISYRKPIFGPSEASRASEVKINAFLQALIDDTVEASR